MIDWTSLYFNSWHDLARVLFLGIPAYLALAEGLVALTLLVLLQYAITWTSVRLPWFSRLVKSEPFGVISEQGDLTKRF